MDASNRQSLPLLTGLTAVLRADGSKPFWPQWLRTWTAVALLALGTGCQTYSRQSQEMSQAWAAGDAATAAREFGRRAERKADSKDAVVWHLEAGAACRANGDYVESNRHLDAAAARMDEYARRAQVRLGNEAAAVFSNQQNLPYEGRTYERVMVHTYKALNYLALGNLEAARPELIRAYQAQEDAVTENQKRIAAARDAERSSGQAAPVAQTRTDPRLESALMEITRPLEGFQFYADYVNPFTVYLDGLYFLHAGAGASDLERATKSLRRVAEVADSRAAIDADLRLADSGGVPRQASTGGLAYVILETGRGASLEQVRIDIPIIFADVSYVGAAFPKLVVHGDYTPELVIRTGSRELATGRVADLDAVIALDFKKEFPVILTKTLIATAAKAAAGWALNDAARRQDEGLGMLVRLATMGLQAAVNIADTRCWSTLPKEFQALRLDAPPDRTLTLSAPGSPPQQIRLIDGDVVVVYVKSVSAARPPTVSQFRLR